MRERERERGRVRKRGRDLKGFGGDDRKREGDGEM